MYNKFRKIEFYNNEDMVYSRLVELSHHNETPKGRPYRTMPDKIIQINEDLIKHNLKDLVRNSVEETLHTLLDKEADELANAEKYERSSERKGYRSGHYQQNLHTTTGETEQKVPKLKEIPFEIAIIEHCYRRESFVEETLIEIYLVVVSVHRTEDIAKIL